MIPPMHWCRLIAFLAVLGLPACGGDDASAVDGGTVTDATTVDGGVAEPAPPAPAVLPVLGTCPVGWRAIEVEEGVSACDPWPDTGHADCTAVDEAHFAGEPACARVGAACPVGDFADGLPADALVLHVLPGASPGGDGSLSSPYARVADATSGVASGTIIALGKGSLDELIALPRGVVLWGACVAETVLTSSIAESMGAVVEAIGANVVIRNLRIGESARLGAVVNGAGRSLDLEDVVVERTTALALVAAGGADLRLRHVVVRDTAALIDGRFGRGLEVLGGSAVEIDQAVLERNRTDGIFAHGSGVTLSMVGLVVRETQPSLSTSINGHALLVQDGVTATVEASVFEEAQEVGVFAFGAATALSMDQCLVRDTASRFLDGEAGRGVDAASDAVVSVSRSLIERNRESNVNAGRGARVHLSDSVLREGLHDGTGSGGNGVFVRAPGVIELERTLLANNREIALQAEGEGASVTGEDVIIVDTLAGDDGFGGFASVASEGGAVDLRRVRIERARVSAVVSAYRGSTTALEDVVIRDTAADTEGRHGRGINVQDGATASAQRALLERNRVYAAQASEGSEMLLSDIVIRDVLPSDVDGLAGSGIVAQSGATVEVTRAVIERFPELGVMVTDEDTLVRLSSVTVRDALGVEPTGFFGRGVGVQHGARVEGAGLRIQRMLDLGVFAGGTGTTVALENVHIEEVLGRRCRDSTCEAEAFGLGVGTYDTASTELLRFSIRSAALCGVQLASGSNLDLMVGEVTGCAIGACVQVDDYDLGRLSNNVHYRDNGINLDATALPVPAAATPVTDAP